MPVGTACPSARSTCAIGRAGAVTGPAATARSGEAGTPNSCTVPHAWHSGQRPTHFAEAKPHSVQRWAGRDFTPAGGTPRRQRREPTVPGKRPQPLPLDSETPPAARLPGTSASESGSKLNVLVCGTLDAGTATGTLTVTSPARSKVKVTSIDCAGVRSWL